MRARQQRDSAQHSKTYTWLEYAVGTEPQVMARLPSIYLKCTSMIIDTMNFSIDYAAPLASELLHNYNQPALQRALWVSSPSLQTVSRDQVSPAHQRLNTRSNVKMTLWYLGTGFSVTGEIINPKDELCMFQQICGGESICVFKGYLSPGDTFQIISRRHHGYPFSASIYINGLITARISWCCEYRHHVGFQQGRRSCFRITQVSGGKPCCRCLQSHENYQTRAGRKQSSGSTYQGSITSKDMGRPSPSPCPNMSRANHTEKTRGNMETTTWEPHNFHHSAPNTQSTPPVRKMKRMRKKKPRRTDGSDSEQQNKVPDKNLRRMKPKRRSRTRCKTPSLKDHESEQDQAEAAGGDLPEKIRAPVHSRAGAAQRPRVTRSKGCTDLRDLSAVSTEQQPDDSSRHTEEEPKDADCAETTIHKRLQSAFSEWSRNSEVELSDSSESSDNPSSNTAVEQQVAAESQDQISEVSAEDEGLVCQITDLMAVLQECDEVDQLVLRNTGMTDALFHRLAAAISASSSEVESINLNLNEIGPEGAKTMVCLLRDKPCVRSLLLYGNRLGAAGVQTIMAGLSDLWLPAWGAPGASSSVFQLSELDIGGNQMGSDGLRSIATFLKMNPPLRQLCLAQSSVQDMDAWAELFDAMKVNTTLTHLLLDENSLGDPGAKLLGEVIEVNRSLLSLDLDANDIGDEGGRAIIESLRASGATLTSISLDNNPLSAGTINTINQSLVSRSC